MKCKAPLNQYEKLQAQSEIFTFFFFFFQKRKALSIVDFVCVCFAVK